MGIALGHAGSCRVHVLLEFWYMLRHFVDISTTFLFVAFMNLTSSNLAHVKLRTGTVEISWRAQRTEWCAVVDNIGHGVSISIGSL